MEGTEIKDSQFGSKFKPWILCMAFIVTAELIYLSMDKMKKTEEFRDPSVHEFIYDVFEDRPLDVKEERIFLEFKNDPKREIKKRWLDVPETECREFETSYVEKKSAPYVPLMSIPGSGNTWVRYLIESLSGVYSGDVFSDGSLAVIFPGSARERPEIGTTFAVKTHASFGNGNPGSGKKMLHPWKVLIIIRNAYEASLAEYNRQKAHGHTTSVTQIDKNNKLIGKMDFLRTWNSYIQWAVGNAKLKNENETDIKTYKASDFIHILHFENLMQDLKTEMVELVDFLGFEMDPIRLRCLLLYPTGSFKRPKPKDKHTFPFPESLKDRALNETCTVQKLIQDAGLKPIPLDLYTESLRNHFMPDTNTTLPIFEC